jgi:26S proteasome regulatory subunit N5
MNIFVHRELLNLFVHPELIRWAGLCNIFEKELKFGAPNSAPTKVFASETEFGEKRWTDLKKRVVEHVSINENPNDSSITRQSYTSIIVLCSQNIRVMAKYYNRITLERMSALLDLPAQVPMLFG